MLQYLSIRVAQLRYHRLRRKQVELLVVRGLRSISLNVRRRVWLPSRRKRCIRRSIRCRRWLYGRLFIITGAHFQRTALLFEVLQHFVGAL